MSELDYMNFKHDMEELADADYSLWIWQQECEYYLAVLYLLCVYPCFTRQPISFKDAPF